MFDYKQPPTTDEYRNGWERIFGKEENEKEDEDGKRWSRNLKNQEEI